MSIIESFRDQSLAQRLWENYVTSPSIRDEKAAVSLESLATAFQEGGTEPDWARACYRARRTVKLMEASDLAAWVPDPDGSNAYYRMLTLKERNERWTARVKSAAVKIPDERFK